eukprot:4641012-Ditylum_brightwellii.AAC.1
MPLFSSWTRHLRPLWFWWSWNPPLCQRECAWEAAGKPSPINSPLIAGIARIIAIPLLYHDGRKCPIDVFLVSSYAPDSGCHKGELTKYLQALFEVCNMAPQGSTIIIGADTNVQLGHKLTLKTEGIGHQNSRIMGPFSTHCTTNPRGMSTAHTLAAHFLTSAAT